MSQASFDLCQFAVERSKNLARWRNLWTILLFAIGAIVVVFFCASVFLFMNETWLPGAIGTLGTLVNGVSVGWVVKRRREAVEEETAAFDELKKLCQSQSPATEEAASTAPSEHARSPLQEVLDYQSKLKLLNLIR